MPLALILSSYVAASRVGGGGQLLTFARAGIDPVLAPTCALGRRPGRGETGGGVIEDARFATTLGGIEAEGLFGLADAVVTGWFATARQVELAAETIDRVRGAVRGRAWRERPIAVVDPILGDAHTGLYIGAEVARAQADLLVPRAEWITPNLFELARLTGAEPAGPLEAARAAGSLGRGVLVTSVPVDEGEIGLVLAEPDGAAWLFSHPRLPEAPHGAGDVVTAVFAAGLIDGLEPRAAAERAARAAWEAVSAAHAWSAPELPLVALGERLVRPRLRVRVRRLS